MKKSKILVLGSNGLVGRTVKERLLKSEKVEEVISSTRKDTDLFSLDETKNLIASKEPDLIINAAAKATFANSFIITLLSYRKETLPC